MWINTGNGGFFCRHPQQRNTKFAFTNFGVSYGLASWKIWPERVDRINQFFECYQSHDEYDTKSITHVMHMNSIHPGVLLASYQPPKWSSLHLPWNGHTGGCLHGRNQNGLIMHLDISVRNQYLIHGWLILFEWEYCYNSLTLLWRVYLINWETMRLYWLN